MSDTAPGPGWRAEVRDTVAAILEDRIDATRQRVHRARVWPATLKPALLVYGYAERKAATSEGGWQHQFEATCNMVVKVLCEGVSPARVEAECEDLVRQVEGAVLRAPELWAPEGGIVRRCAGVETQIVAEQKDKKVEVEATLQFVLVWDEVFTAAEPETTPCEGVEYQPHHPALTPTP